MPFYEKGAVRIHFEEAGSGFPLLLIAGGGLNSMRCHGPVLQGDWRVQCASPRCQLESGRLSLNSPDLDARATSQGRVVHFAYYNFCRIHSSIRVTPAREAGITDHVWDLAELLA
jgi:hypothetical protein